MSPRSKGSPRRGRGRMWLFLTNHPVHGQISLRFRTNPRGFGRVLQRNRAAHRVRRPVHWRFGTLPPVSGRNSSRNSVHPRVRGPMSSRHSVTPAFRPTGKRTHPASAVDLAARSRLIPALHGMVLNLRRRISQRAPCLLHPINNSPPVRSQMLNDGAPRSTHDTLPRCRHTSQVTPGRRRRPDAP
jgi:hypothetical protein